MSFWLFIEINKIFTESKAHQEILIQMKLKPKQRKKLGVIGTLN